MTAKEYLRRKAIGFACRLLIVMSDNYLKRTSKFDHKFLKFTIHAARQDKKKYRIIFLNNLQNILSLKSTYEEHEVQGALLSRPIRK